MCMCVCVCVSECVLSHIHVCHTMDCSPPGSYVHEIPRQEYWSGCHCLLQEICWIQGWNLSLLYLLHWQADSLSLLHVGSPK